MRDEDLRTNVEAATRAAFTRLIDCALSEHVKAVLISGDLFDGKERSARTAAFLTGQFDRLRAADIRVFYIKGNHDAENPITGALDLPDNVHVFDARGGKVQLAENIWVHGVSFAGRHASESLLPRFAEPVSSAVNSAMLHTSLAGASGHDTYAPCSISDLRGAGFDYWALGHVHKRQVHAKSPWVVMPGMPQGRDIGEAGPKSASLLTIRDEKIEVEEVPTSVVEFLSSSLDVTDAVDDDALRALLREHLRTTAATLSSAAGVLRLTLSGSPLRSWQIQRDRDFWSEQINALSRDTGCLWIDRVIFDLQSTKTPSGAANAVDELYMSMMGIQAEPGFSNLAQAEIDEMIQDLPPTVRAQLLPDETAAKALFHRLAEAGARNVFARMKGVDS